MSYNQSAEDIYNEMFLGYTETNTGEGSLLYSACMPVCMKLSQAYLNLDEVTKKIFAKTALESGYSSYLKMRVEEVGMKEKQATYASTKIVVNGSPNATFKANSIVSIKDNRLYITQSDLVLDQNGNGEVTIKAENPGSKYNAKVNEINYLPIKYTGITSITNKEAVTNGYNAESDQDLYNRYQLKVQTPSTSGNKYHYQNWALEVDGVGSAKAYPLWDKNNGMNGNGTVKVVIANSNKRAASEELIKNVAAHIEEERPIGPTVTVVSVEELPLNIIVSLIYDSTTYTLDIIKTNVSNTIKDYLKGIALKTDHISIAKIGALILSTSGVTDYSNLTINGSIANVPIKDNQIAVLNEVVCNVT